MSRYDDHCRHLAAFPFLDHGVLYSLVQVAESTIDSHIPIGSRPGNGRAKDRVGDARLMNRAFLRLPFAPAVMAPLAKMIAVCISIEWE